MAGAWPPRRLPAVGAMSTNPKNTISQLKRLLGKKFSDPQVQQDLAYFPFKVVEGPSGECLYEVGCAAAHADYMPCSACGQLAMGTAGWLLHGKAEAGARAALRAPLACITLGSARRCCARCSAWPQRAFLPCALQLPWPGPNLGAAVPGAPTPQVQYLDKQHTFTAEQLMAMLLVDLKEVAEADGVAVSEAVLSVPTYFTEPERHAMLAAAQVSCSKQSKSSLSWLVGNVGMFPRGGWLGRAASAGQGCKQTAWGSSRSAVWPGSGLGCTQVGCAALGHKPAPPPPPACGHFRPSWLPC